MCTIARLNLVCSFNVHETYLTCGIFVFMLLCIKNTITVQRIKARSKATEKYRTFVQIGGVFKARQCKNNCLATLAANRQRVS